MKGCFRYVIFSIFLVSGCGGSLSNEQRQEMNEARSKQEIRKVTEAELINSAMVQGGEIAQKAALLSNDGNKLRDLALKNNAKIRWVEVGSKNALEMEKQIIDAYVLSVVVGEPPENVQMFGEDSIMYSKPVVENLPDGAVQVKGMWSIIFSKKDLILSMPQ